MARVKGSIQESFSGKIDNLVFVQRYGQTYVRQLPDKRKPEEWSIKQRIGRLRFKSMIIYANKYKESVIKPIWNKPAKELKINGFNLFLKANQSAFGSTGSVADYSLLHFSTGSLSLPFNLNAVWETEEHHSILVTWNYEATNVSNQDDALIWICPNTISDNPMDSGFTKKDKKAVIPVSLTNINDLRIYLFFHNKKLDIYSEDKMFILKI